AHAREAQTEQDGGNSGTTRMALRRKPGYPIHDERALGSVTARACARGKSLYASWHVPQGLPLISQRHLAVSGSIDEDLHHSSRKSRNSRARKRDLGHEARGEEQDSAEGYKKVFGNQSIKAIHQLISLF